MDRNYYSDKAPHYYLHVDLDAFFASVEQLDNPEYRGKPVIVGGKPGDRRSVVSTASYEARKFGVHSAMPTFQAYKLCPQGIFVHGRMHRYAELSHQIMTIFRDYSPDVDQMSIDEAFIDLTGTEKLFGPAKDTALAIKERVKKETGLTVSVGLASTKYLAKIASGLSKPDGFFIIKPGDEESFMLKLPLNKVWGLGPKSLELIRSKGFFSTQDIYDRDYNTLEFLFGKNMAGFLYNVVRGIEKESFSRESKSHSISAENTFQYDLTDIYTIETELLELCQGVFFRLLKEESFSRTAFVKIRYDDFSTCTVQETLERNIITLDSFFEIIKKLFEKRYEKGRGIRLLGVGFENIEKEEKPYQQDLFSTNNDEKKQAVEKAILKLSKKHPEIKVSKARTLKAIFLFFMLGSLPFKLNAEEYPNAEDTEEMEAPENIEVTGNEEEAPVYLFDYDINDKNHVDFSASGLWKIDFSTGLDISFGNGTETAFSPTLPLFKQETDISTLLTLNKHWYFEAAFADEFTRNTFAFGYRGEELVRHFRLANRGIRLNKEYSSDHFGYSVRGGNNQAPGMLLELVSPSEKIQSDFLLRYDMTESKSQIYYGMNKVTDVKIPAGDFEYGREFHFPEGCENILLEINELYIESTAGSFSDSQGKKFRRLRKDEYAIVRTSYGETRLFISQEAGGGKNSQGNIPQILLSFRNSSKVHSILAAAGSWDNPESFFGKIQKELGNNGQYKIKDYCNDFTKELEGESCLIIQNDHGFSPFLCPSLYKGGKKEEADFLVISDKSEMPVNRFKAFEAEEIYANLYEDFLKSDQMSIRVLNKEKPQSDYPFAEDFPEIYLGIPVKENLVIRSRSYSPVSEIIISKKAAADTVQVYKNGNLLNGILFDENTGVITLNTTVSQTDQLLITWQEESSDFTEGAVTAAAGIKFHFLPVLTGDIILSTRQPVTKKDDFIENGSQKNSFTALSTGLEYSDYGLTLKEKASVSLLKDNSSEGLLIYSWEKIWEDYLDEYESQSNFSSADAEKIEKPVKAPSITFLQEDFSAYKKINVEVDLLNEDKFNFSGPLRLIMDQDTGSSQRGKEALILYINDIEKIPAFKKSAYTHTISILSDENKIFIDDEELSENDFVLKVDKGIIPSRLSLEINDSSEKHNVLIEKVTYSEASYYGSFRNYAGAEYKKDGSIISINDFDILKDFYVKAESDQGSGNFEKAEPFVSARTSEGITLSGVKLAFDAAFSDLAKNTEISEAGHSIQTDGNYLPFKIISAQDTYRYKPDAEELRKENLFALDFSPLNFPFKGSLQTSAEKSLYHGKQNSEISAGYNQKLFDSQIGIGAKLTAGQRIASDNMQKQSYTEGWKDISLLEFSDGKEEAEKRNLLWSYTLDGSFPFQNNLITFKPKLTYELSDIYQPSISEKSNNPAFTDKEFLSLLLPFSSEQKFFSFEVSRTGGGKKEILKGGSYADDSEKLYALQKERDFFYSSIPFYELFDKNLKEKLYEETSYASMYEGNFRRSLFNSKKDIIIPSSLTLAVSRETSRQLPESDLYQFKTVITNNSINNFGSESAGKHFSWFSQEELTTSLTAILKLPSDAPDNFKISIQTYAQLLLFISEKEILSELLDCSIDDRANWNIRDTLSYSRPSAVSLLTALASLFTQSGDLTNYSISRKDSFTAEVGMNEAELQQKYSYKHTVGVDFLEYYNVNAGIGGSLILNQHKADLINLTLSLGAKAEF